MKGFFGLLLPGTCVFAAVSRNSRRQGGQLQPSPGDWGSIGKTACLVRLESFGMPEMKTANEIFQETEGSDVTKVLETQPDDEGKTKRLLVFQSSDGGCNPQAGMHCRRNMGPRPHPAPPALFLQRILSRKRSSSDQAKMSDPGDDAADLSMKDSCAGNRCDPDIEGSVGGTGGGYLRSMLAAISRLDQPPSRALSIGLGAGTLNTWLQQRYPSVDQTVAELSSSVADTARGCFGMPSSVKVQVADGRKVLEDQEDSSLDVLFVDAFDAEHDDVPACLMTQEFFQTAAQKLRPGGVLSMNLHSGGTLADDVHAAVPSAQTAFPEVSTGTCPGLANRIMVAQTATLFSGVPPPTTPAASPQELMEAALEPQQREKQARPNWEKLGERLLRQKAKRKDPLKDAESLLDGEKTEDLHLESHHQRLALNHRHFHEAFRRGPVRQENLDDDELSSWWMEANYATLPKSSNSATSDTRSSCSR